MYRTVLLIAYWPHLRHIRSVILMLLFVLYHGGTTAHGVHYIFYALYPKLFSRHLFYFVLCAMSWFSDLSLELIRFIVPGSHLLHSMNKVLVYIIIN